MILLGGRRETGRERDGEYRRSGRDASTIAGLDKRSRRKRRAQVTRRAGSDKNGGKNYCERAHTGSSERKSGARRRVDTAQRGIMVLPIYLAPSRACQQPTTDFVLRSSIIQTVSSLRGRRNSRSRLITPAKRTRIPRAIEYSLNADANARYLESHDSINLNSSISSTRSYISIMNVNRM